MQQTINDLLARADAKRQELRDDTPSARASEIEAEHTAILKEFPIFAASRRSRASPACRRAPTKV
jgi:hypothetical protein